MVYAHDNNSLLSDQNTNQFFGVGGGLNLESLIQPLETLSIELVETYYKGTTWFPTLYRSKGQYWFSACTNHEDSKVLITQKKEKKEKKDSIVGN